MMSLNNLNWLWDHLPAHVRDGGEGGNHLLRRFLSGIGAELDAVDAAYDSFHLRLAPDTAPAEFVEFWLWSLYGWGWFPDWFTLAQRRSFYGNVARHYARRGTARGIVEFLLEFGIRSRVITEPLFYEDWALEDEEWLVEGPLVIIVQIFNGSAGVAQEQTYYEDWALEEDALDDDPVVPTRADIDQLLDFQQPVGQLMVIEEKI